MKQESIDKLKEAVLSTYAKFGDDRAVLLKSGKSYTGKDIVNEIESETDFGVHLIENILNLSIELIKRDKINVNPEHYVKRYDATVDRFLTLPEFIGECYGGLPSESLLEEQWLELPLTKPDELVQEN